MAQTLTTVQKLFERSLDNRFCKVFHQQIPKQFQPIYSWDKLSQHNMASCHKIKMDCQSTSFSMHVWHESCKKYHSIFGLSMSREALHFHPYTHLPITLIKHKEKKSLIEKEKVWLFNLIESLRLQRQHWSLARAYQSTLADEFCKSRVAIMLHTCSSLEWAVPFFIEWYCLLYLFPIDYAPMTQLQLCHPL